MKSLAVMVVLCLLPELAVGGLFYNGNKLYSGLGYCQELQGTRLSGQASVGKAYSCERAIGYVMGVSDSLNGTNACQPTGLNSDQLRDVMHQWLEDNPVKRHESAAVLIQQALLEAWPCPAEYPSSY